MTRFLRYALIIGGALMSILLFFLTTVSENSSRFERYYEWLLDANAVVALALLILVLTLVLRLFRRFRAREFGSKLMTRLVVLFALVGILPGTVIYVVSVQFVSRSIESWFDVKVESALDSGKNMGMTALDFLLADLQSKAKDMASELSDPSESSMSIHLSRLRERMQVQEATIVNSKGRLIASANENVNSLLPELPTQDMLRQVKLSRFYAARDEKLVPTPGSDDDPATASASSNSAANAASGITETRGATRPALAPEPARILRSRVVVPLRMSTGWISLQNEALYLQLIQPVPINLAMHAEALSNASREYQVRSIGRVNLKKMYIITLTLTLLLAIVAAITSAFLISGELARPLLLLAEGTKAVTEGNFSPRPIVTSTDELGSLTKSFNTMTRQLFDARATVEKNRNELENAKAYLESVLANMSAGVMVLDQNGNLVTCNESVERILQRRLESEINKPLADIDGMQAFAFAISKAFSEQHAQSAAGGENEREQHWQQQIEVPRPNKGKKATLPATPAAPGEAVVAEDEQSITLLARGSHLPVASGSGYVVVFDDISNIISAQRSIAWGEVARRLAHEIKNPLTPIQLSAERLQMKLQDKLSETDVLILNKSTTTIVNQVTSMKRMVDDFRDYARTPPAVLMPLNLAGLIDEVLHLYIAGDGRDAIKLTLAADLPKVMGDATQMRQVIHNLLQNAQDAVADNTTPGFVPRIDVITDVVRYTGTDQIAHSAVRLSIIDNGPGFSSKILARAFEPYATSKPRGTGLGLAMVKKIIDEHGGRIDIQNRSDTNGAKVAILLLKLAPDANTA